MQITSNNLDSLDDILLRLDDSGKLHHLGNDQKPDLYLIVGEIASDFGFKTGYFLHDLFIKKLSERFAKNVLTPFIVISGPFDHA